MSDRTPPSSPRAGRSTVSAAGEPTCPFCERIKRGEYEPINGSVVAFEPLNPVTPGHLLVVPFRHVSDARQDPDTAAACMRAAAELSDRAAFAANIITSIGAAATQTVHHLHVHVVPRRENDGLALPWAASPAGAEAVPQSEPPQLRTFAEWVRDVDPTTTTWPRAKQWAVLALAGADSVGQLFDPSDDPDDADDPEPVPQSEREGLDSNYSQMRTVQEIAIEHRLCGPKYDGCYSHWPTPHCRADGMSWPCDVDAIRAALASPAHPDEEPR